MARYPGRVNSVSLGPKVSHSCRTHHAAPHCCAGHEAPSEPSNPDSVALGVVDMRPLQRVALNTQEAASWALAAALQAAAHGSTGVGGVMLGPHRELLAISSNRVYHEGKLVDPTAHGERQLVDWYFEQKRTDPTLPPPEQCTVVTTLDPCMMCTGSLLAGGFNVISSSLDAAGGVNYDGTNRLTALPASVRETAHQRFAYFAVDGVSPYQGPAVFGERPSISAEVSSRSSHAFLGSVKQPRPHADEPAPDLAECPNPAVEALLKRYSPDALSVRSQPGQPGPELAEPLLRAARQSAQAGGSFDAAALLDPHGNLVMVRGNQEGLSPLRTPLMELTRAWAQARAEVPPELKDYLPPLRECTVVTLKGPASDGAGVMELGAYGSSLKSQAAMDTPSWQYVLPSQPQQQLEESIRALPPHYSEKIRPRIDQVTDGRLVELCAPSVTA